MVERGSEYILAHTGPRELDGHPLGGCGSGFWFSSQLYYPFGKGPGQHIIRCLKNKKCENERSGHKHTNPTNGRWDFWTQKHKSHKWKVGLQCVAGSQRVAVCRSVLRCVTVCCSVLKCVTVCCSVLQCVAICCSVLKCVAMCCSVLQCVAVCCSVLQYAAVCNSVLQCVVVCCSVLSCVAVCCSVLQCVAVCCSVL